MIKAVILDMDGVIVDTEAIHMEAFRRYLMEHHVKFTEKFIQSLVGYSIQDNIREIKRKFFENKRFDIDAGIKRRNKIYLDLISSQDLQPLPGILELISYCKNHQIKLALASSSDWQQVDTILTKIFNNYYDKFNVIITGDDVQNKKPAPDIYLQTVEKLNLIPNSCIAFEDSQAGVESAKAAGVICFAIQNRYFSDSQLKKAKK